MYLGNVLSDCVCEQNVKFPEDLFKETIHGVPLFCVNVLDIMKKELGLVCWTGHF